VQDAVQGLEISLTDFGPSPSSISSAKSSSTWWPWTIVATFLRPHRRLMCPMAHARLSTVASARSRLMRILCSSHISISATCARVGLPFAFGTSSRRTAATKSRSMRLTSVSLEAFSLRGAVAVGIAHRQLPRRSVAAETIGTPIHAPASASMRSFCVPSLPLPSCRATSARVDVKRDVNTLSRGDDRVSGKEFRLVRPGADSHSQKLGRLDSNRRASFHGFSPRPLTSIKTTV
jgi:hypothetical protein